MTVRPTLETIVPSRALARDLREWFETGMPRHVENHALRCLINAVAAGMSGSRDSSTQALIDGLRQANGQGDAPLLGRSDRLPPVPSALVNSFAVTQNDFDDAHFKTVLHPSAPAVAGLMGSSPESSGLAALRAFALGCEVQLALASAISPSHYSRGWHTSATCAAIGSAVTYGLLLGLGDEELSRAIDLALIDVVGLRQSHGTETKGYQVGRGAANGLSAAIAVANGAVDAVPGTLGVHEGFMKGISDGIPGPVGVTGEPWLLLEVGLKPYPAGLVCFAAIEAALEASRAVDAQQVESILLEVPPLAIELAGRVDPVSQSEARVSLPHAVAASLVERAAGPDQFSRQAIENADIARIRDMVELIPGQLGEESAVLHIRTSSQVGTWSVGTPLGGPDRPLTDQDLEAKVELLVSAFASPGHILEALWALPDAETLHAFFQTVSPNGGALL